MTAVPAYQFEPEWFDETDGAYAVAEPDPWGEGDVRAPLARPSLRVELGSAPAQSINTLARRALPPLPVTSRLSGVLPNGLRRGSTIAVTSSVSLLLTLLGEASARGAWTALVGMPTLSAEAAVEAGIDLERFAVITPPDAVSLGSPPHSLRSSLADARYDSHSLSAPGGWTSATWTTAVGALLDAVDIVVARPGLVAVGDGDARRLTARTRTKDAVLVLFGQPAAQWPAVEVTLSAEHAHWRGIGDGRGRIKGRRLVVSATGKGRSARPRTAELEL